MSYPHVKAADLEAYKSERKAGCRVIEKRTIEQKETKDNAKPPSVHEPGG